MVTTNNPQCGKSLPRLAGAARKHPLFLTTHAHEWNQRNHCTVCWSKPWLADDVTPFRQICFQAVLGKPQSLRLSPESPIPTHTHNARWDQGSDVHLSFRSGDRDLAEKRSRSHWWELSVGREQCSRPPRSLLPPDVKGAIALRTLGHPIELTLILQEGYPWFKIVLLR